MIPESWVVAVRLRVGHVDVEVFRAKFLRPLTEATLCHLILASLRSREYPSHFVVGFSIMRTRIGKWNVLFVLRRPSSVALSDYVLIRLFDATDSHEAVLVLIWHKHTLWLLLLASGFDMVWLPTHQVHHILLVLDLHCSIRWWMRLLLWIQRESTLTTGSCNGGRNAMILAVIDLNYTLWVSHGLSFACIALFASCWGFIKE